MPYDKHLCFCLVKSAVQVSGVFFFTAHPSTILNKAKLMSYDQNFMSLAYLESSDQIILCALQLNIMF